jgi:hypothetical protein
MIVNGSPADKARKAADAIASYENRFAAIDQRCAKVESDLNLLKWMVGFNLAINVGIVFILLRH